jgi:hypothetical protein
MNPRANGHRDQPYDKAASAHPSQLESATAGPGPPLPPLQDGDCRYAQLLRSPHRYIWPAELALTAQLAGFLWGPSTPTGPARSSPPGLSHVSVHGLPTNPVPGRT